MSKSKACALLREASSTVAPSWFSRSFASSQAVMQEQFLRHIMTGTTLASVSKGKLGVISHKVWTISAACSSASLVGSNGCVGCQNWKQNGIDCLKSGFQKNAMLLSWLLGCIVAPYLSNTPDYWALGVNVHQGIQHSRVSHSTAAFFAGLWELE